MPPKTRRRKAIVRVDPIRNTDKLDDENPTEANLRKSEPLKNLAASEIARNPKYFAEYAQSQGLQKAYYSDLPLKFQQYATTIFEFKSRIPLNWVTDDSKVRKYLKELTPDFVNFMKKAYKACPSMFYEATKTPETNDNKEMQTLFADLHAVLLAWKRIKRMGKSNQKWSESDYASGVYNVFRSPAIRKSIFRANCSISLPRSMPQEKKLRLSIVQPKMAIPDSCIFIKHSSIRTLSEGSTSPYTTLSRLLDAFSDSEQDILKNEATPRFNIGDKDQFEFISSCWEDKKTTDELLESAYRQNRMVCAGVCRHMRAFKISLPVFGIIWTQGKVFVHVDWCNSASKGPQDTFICSAAYPGPEKTDRLSALDSSSDSSTSSKDSRSEMEFHQWDLSKPHEILQVYCLLRNIDSWTSGTFKDRVSEGIFKIVDEVKNGNVKLDAWKVNEERRLPLRPIKASTRPRANGGR